MPKRLVVVAGNIGVGKSTLVQIMHERLGWEPFYEAVVENPYLADFYHDMRSWSFHLQIYFLGHRARQHIEMAEDPRSAIIDRSIYEDAYIFARALNHMGNLSERDFLAYRQVFDLGQDQPEEPVGGDAGMDNYGFSPGLRLAYRNDTARPEWWGVSAGMFAAGPGAAYDDSFRAPFVITQLETGRKFFGGLSGNYRLYRWSNGQATQFRDGVNFEDHSGWGISADQRVGAAHDQLAVLLGDLAHAAAVVHRAVLLDRAAHDDQQGALLPARMGDAD